MTGNCIFLWILVLTPAQSGGAIRGTSPPSFESAQFHKKSILKSQNVKKTNLKTLSSSVILL